MATFTERNQISDQDIHYVVIVARENNQWLFVKHRERTTWELPGGKREHDESLLQAAKRELYEETGTQGYLLQEVCAYKRFDQDNDWGLLWFAEVTKRGPLPQSEITEVHPATNCPGEWTHEAHPELLKYVEKAIK